MVKLIKGTVLVVLIFIFQNCNMKNMSHIQTNNNNWQMVPISKSTGADSFDYHFNQAVHFSNNLGFIIGNNRGELIHNAVVNDTSFNNEKLEAVFFRTNNGGTSFQKHVLGKGNLIQIHQNSLGTLFLVNQKIVNKNTSQKLCELYQSKDSGTSWKLINTIDASEIKVAFLNDLIGIMVDTSSKPMYYKTKDGGKSWEIISFKFKNIVIPDNTLVINPNEFELYQHLGGLRQIIRYNPLTDTIHKINPQLRDGEVFRYYRKDQELENIYSYINKNKQDETISLWNHRTNSREDYSLDLEDTENVIGICRSTDYIGVLISAKDRTYYLYRGLNDSKWKEEVLPDPFITGNAISLFGKGNIWTGSLRNMYAIQVRKEPSN